VSGAMPSGLCSVCKAAGGDSDPRSAFRDPSYAKEEGGKKRQADGSIIPLETNTHCGLGGGLENRKVVVELLSWSLALRRQLLPSWPLQTAHAQSRFCITSG
jgi:hypothetical protein